MELEKQLDLAHEYLPEGYAIVPIDPSVPIREKMQDIFGCSFLATKWKYKQLIEKASHGI